MAAALATVVEAQEPQTKTYRADYQRACNNPENPDEADLCQQWRSANAAEKTAKIAQGQFWATVTETGLLVFTLILSGWAALAASSAARTARRELEELERPNLLVNFTESGAQDGLWGTDMPAPTKLVFHNYGRSPGFMVTFYARHFLRTKEQGLPHPVMWDDHNAPIFPYGSIVKHDGDSEVFTVNARDFYTGEDVMKLGKEAVWYLQGFAAYHDTMSGLYNVGFTFVYADGEWRIAQVGDWRDMNKYNYSYRRNRPTLLSKGKRGLARALRGTAERLSPTAKNLPHTGEPPK